LKKSAAIEEVKKIVVTIEDDYFNNDKVNNRIAA
jgi:hypothetical protein